MEILKSDNTQVCTIDMGVQELDTGSVLLSPGFVIMAGKKELTEYFIQPESPTLIYQDQGKSLDLYFS